MSTLSVHIWSDIACPWCYIGKRRFEKALAEFEHRDRVDITWRAFELDTEAPRIREPHIPYAQRLAQKYQRTVEQGQEMVDTMTSAGRDEGLDMRFDLIRPGNTLDAHRLLHAARESGLASPLKERLLRGYFTEGEAIGDTAALTRLAVNAGMDPTVVEAVLTSDRHTDDVRSDQRQARELGITGVPFFVLTGAKDGAQPLGLSGAQPPDVIRQALEQAWRTSSAR